MNFKKITVITLAAAFLITFGYNLSEANCQKKYNKQVKKCNKINKQIASTKTTLEKTQKKIGNLIKKKKNPGKLYTKQSKLEKKLRDLPGKYDKCMDDAEEALFDCKYKKGEFADGWNKKKFDKALKKITNAANTARESRKSCFGDCHRYWKQIGDLLIDKTITVSEYRKANENYLNCIDECIKGFSPRGYEKKKKALMREVFPK